MNILTLLVPVSLGLGLVGLAAFLWMLRHGQFDDPAGQAHRVLSDRWDDGPAPEPLADPAHDAPRNPLDDPGGRP